ncbi:retrovirus-related Pol polyprotein from transposon 412 [Trichonephila clavipes]|nr:retrovirus-related Pol polyprotein from transposon 412 [Trichonephila clavipes]
MACRQNLRRRRITCWVCGGAGQLRSSSPRINTYRNFKCWGCGRTGHVRSNCSRVNQEDPCRTSEMQQNLRVKKKVGLIDPIIQVTTPSTSALDPWSDESIRKDQLADSEIKPIIEFKKSSDEKPCWQDIAPFHPTTKRYWALWDSLHLRNGVLYRKWESDDGKTFRWQLMLPKTRVSTVLTELHGSPTGGPLPRSSDENNNILVVKDYFTKWPEAYPIPNQDASAVAEVLVQHWISPFGVPIQLHSDQERNFDSAFCKRLCEILAIYKTRATALHSQSDGIAERFFRTILNSLSLLVSSNEQDWDKKLPFFFLAYRSSVHETIGSSPSQMLFARDLRLPADLLFSRPLDAPLAPEEYIEKLQARMDEMHHSARERIGMASEKMKTQCDARATGHDFHEGNKV